MLGAVAQQYVLRAVSPTDLAYYHQSIWSAGHGLGFAQTVLQFDGSSLLGSLHLDLIRVALVPLYVILPSVYTLVGLQALGIGVAALLTACLAEESPGEPPVPGWLGPVVMSLACLHPLSIELALADFRPLVLLVPGTLLSLWALEHFRLGWMLLGGLVTISAREEGWQVLGALLPYAGLKVWRLPPTSRKKAFSLLLGLLGLTLLGLGLPLLAWGKLTQLSATASWQEVLVQLSAGERPLFRSPEEARLGGWSLLVLFPVLWVPELLLPALAAMGVLTIFSPFEGVGPGGRGIHYWSVVQPLLLGAWALGLGRARRWLHARARGGFWLLLLVSGLLMLEGSRVPLERVSQRVRDGYSPPPALVELHGLLKPLGESSAGLLVSPALSGLLANRSLLRVVGEARLDPPYVAETVAHIHAAVLEVGETEELLVWQAALEQAGFEVTGEAAGQRLWQKPVPAR